MENKNVNIKLDLNDMQDDSGDIDVMFIVSKKIYDEILKKLNLVDDGGFSINAWTDSNSCSIRFYDKISKKQEYVCCTPGFCSDNVDKNGEDGTGYKVLTIDWTNDLYIKDKINSLIKNKNGSAYLIFKLPTVGDLK